MPQCRGCKQDLPASAFACDRQRRDGLRYKCRACSSEEFKRYQQTPSYKARLAKQLAARHAEKRDNPKLRWAKVAVNQSRARAKAKGMEHTITVNDVLPLCVDVCRALGCKLTYANKKSHWHAAALDRIDNDKGYVPENVWVISMRANRIKTDATPAEIAAVAEAVRLAVDKGLVTVLKEQKSATVLPPPKPVSNPYAA